MSDKQVESHRCFSSPGFLSKHGAQKTTERERHLEECMTDDNDNTEIYPDEYVQTKTDRMTHESSRSPTPPYRACDYSSEENEEGEESGGLEKCKQFYLSQRDDPSFWSVGSVNGPFRKTGCLLGQPASFRSFTCSRKNHFV